MRPGLRVKRHEVTSSITEPTSEGLGGNRRTVAPHLHFHTYILSHFHTSWSYFPITLSLCVVSDADERCSAR